MPLIGITLMCGRRCGRIPQ